MVTMELNELEAEIIRYMRLPLEDRMLEDRVRIDAAEQLALAAMTVQERATYDAVCRLTPEAQQAYGLLIEQERIAAELAKPIMATSVAEAQAILQGAAVIVDEPEPVIRGR